MYEKLSRWWDAFASRLLLIKDEPHRLAKGVALGVMMNFLPTFGLGTFIAFFSAPLLRANAPAAAMGALAFKWALPFFYLANLAVGSWIFRSPVQLPDPFTIHSLGQLSLAFVLGSVINGAAAFIAVYIIMLRTLRILQKFRKRR